MRLYRKHPKQLGIDARVAETAKKSEISTISQTIINQKRHPLFLLQHWHPKFYVVKAKIFFQPLWFLQTSMFVVV